MTDLRDAFFDEVTRLAMANPNYIVLSDDQDVWGLRPLATAHPEQFINTGIAEQNMIGVAAGLALAGKRVVCVGQANFMVLRALEFIRNDLCVMDLPVTLAVLGAGYTFGYDGPTHHAVNDVAIMRALPGMTVLNPADETTSRFAARLTAQRMHPLYVRVERGEKPVLYPVDFGFDDGLGVVRFDALADVNLVATGNMTHKAIMVADILQTYGVLSSVADVYQLKPVNDVLLSGFCGDRPVVTFEEHSLIGGLASIVDSLCLRQRVKHFALEDEYAFRYGSREWMQVIAGLEARPMAVQIARWLKQRRQ